MIGIFARWLNRTTSFRDLERILQDSGVPRFITKLNELMREDEEMKRRADASIIVPLI